MTQQISRSQINEINELKLPNIYPTHKRKVVGQNLKPFEAIRYNFFAMKIEHYREPRWAIIQVDENCEEKTEAF